MYHHLTDAAHRRQALTEALLRGTSVPLLRLAGMQPGATN
jgi:hypothetical protein